MSEKSKKEVQKLENLKKKKLNEVLGIVEEEEKEKIDIKKFKKIFFLLIIVLTILTIVFLCKKYIEYQQYIEDTKESIILAEKYKEEQLRKEEEERKIKKEEEEEKLRKEKELKDLKKLNFETINNLPDEKKELMLNIIPSGNPLKKEAHINSPFGMRIHPVSGVKKLHEGIDIKLSVGDDVMSTAIGRVVFAGKKNGYGNVVIVEHMYGFQTAYAHLDKIYVKYGEIVGKGKVIAAGGNSGLSTGPHLHYEVRYNGIPINPKNFMDWNKKEFNIVFENERSVPWEYFLTIMGKN